MSKIIALLTMVLSLSAFAGPGTSIVEMIAKAGLTHSDEAMKSLALLGRKGVSVEAAVKSLTRASDLVAASKVLSALAAKAGKTVSAASILKAANASAGQQKLMNAYAKSIANIGSAPIKDAPLAKIAKGADANLKGDINTLRIFRSTMPAADVAHNIDTVHSIIATGVEPKHAVKLGIIDAEAFSRTGEHWITEACSGYGKGAGLSMENVNKYALREFLAEEGKDTVKSVLKVIEGHQVVLGKTKQQAAMDALQTYDIGAVRCKPGKDAVTGEATVTAVKTKECPIQATPKALRGKTLAFACALTK